MKPRLKELTEMREKLREKDLKTCRELGIVRKEDSLGWVLTDEGWNLLGVLRYYADEEFEKRKSESTPKSENETTYIG